MCLCGPWGLVTAFETNLGYENGDDSHCHLRNGGHQKTGSDHGSAITSLVTLGKLISFQGLYASMDKMRS